MKGQLISKANFEVFIWTKTIICIRFLIWFIFKDLGQKQRNIFVQFLVQVKTSKFAFEIIWPLWEIKGGKGNTLLCQKPISIYILWHAVHYQSLPFSFFSSFDGGQFIKGYWQENRYKIGSIWFFYIYISYIVFQKNFLIRKPYMANILFKKLFLLGQMKLQCIYEIIDFRKYHQKIW